MNLDLECANLLDRLRTVEAPSTVHIGLSDVLARVTASVCGRNATIT